MPLRIIVFILVAAAFFVVPAGVDFLADWLWFGEVGYRQVYSTEISVRALAGAATFLITVAWLTFHLRQAIAAISPAPVTFTTREGFTVALPTRDQVRPLVMVLVAVASFLLASFVSTQWMTLLNWWHQVPFGASDPVLGYDAGFYVFTLPALELVRGFLLGLIRAGGARLGGACISSPVRSR